ncbi:DUF1287 domain-containing protein [Taklimakanibacter lacteus]|uniref:DUF1287 domain-containing protein n=1 Tax=Taklimakanibacter lacteus TaxID=2268456 RepID=UPI0034D7445E
MISRRFVILPLAGLAGAAAIAGLVPAHRLKVLAQVLVDPAPPRPDMPVFARAEGDAGSLIAAGIAQIGVTRIYDPAYVRLPYPGGDVAPERGVCTDVIVRAYRKGLKLDLQKLVHEDMRREFSAYPTTWGLKRPDRNIDHRRVPNLQTFFARQGAGLTVTDRPSDFRPGDIITQMLPGNLPHIALVSHFASADGERPLCIHNIGAGARLEDILFSYRLTGHYRFRI